MPGSISRALQKKKKIKRDGTNLIPGRRMFNQVGTRAKKIDLLESTKRKSLANNLLPPPLPNNIEIYLQTCLTLVKVIIHDFTIQKEPG